MIQSRGALRSWLISGIGIVVALVLSSCGDSADGGITAPEPPAAPPPPAPVHSLTLEPAGGELRFHEERELRAVARDAQGNVLTGRLVTWSTSHPFRVSVSEGGQVRGEGLGEARITALVDSVTATASFTVPAREVSIRMDAEGLITVIDLQHDVECDRDCTRIVPLGAQLDLRVEKGLGIPAVRWPDPCPSESAERCQVLVDSDVELVFRLDVPPLPSYDARPVAVGNGMVCALSDQGQPYCWGANHAGKLGRGTWTQFSVEIEPAHLSEPLHSITAGFDHTCGLSKSGTPYCWGDNHRGALGDGTNQHRTVPSRVHGNPRLVQLSAGLRHTCGLTGEGRIYCWGENAHGQLGDGTRTDRWVPTEVQTEVRFERVRAGFDGTCGLSVEGALLCWGANHDGQLATGDFADALEPRPSNSGARYRDVQLGRSMGCALRGDGQVDCWGLDQPGNLGQGREQAGHLPTPTPIVGGQRFTALAVGQEQHACALGDSGEAFCWGGNWHGALGNGGTQSVSRPEPVAGGHRFQAIGAGHGLTCGLTETGEALCWGQARGGTLGPDVPSHVSAPVPLSPVPRSRAISGQSWHTHCSIAADADDLYCWGGWGPVQHRENPWDVGFQIRGLKQVALGGGHLCGLRGEDGALVCMGNANRGRLGNGWQDGWLPWPGHEVLAGTAVVQIVTGPEHTCALAQGGEAHCWGANDQGQLGDGTWQDRAEPRRVDQGDLQFVRLTAENQTTCGITSERELWCWGNNQFGQVGDGSRQNRSRPTRVGGDLEVADVGIGGAHACLVTARGELYCWGAHWNGQLGARFMRDQLTPVRVPGDQRFRAIALGSSHNCAISMTDEVWCWGENLRGQLGLGHDAERLGPHRVEGLPSSVRELSTSSNTTCALTDAGAVWCWGDNSQGEVGIPLPRVPVRIPAPVRWGGARGGSGGGP
jgi:alpha-tubulin suppressor-like RCC1 family protein